MFVRPTCHICVMTPNTVGPNTAANNLIRISNVISLRLPMLNAFCDRYGIAHGEICQILDGVLPMERRLNCVGLLSCQCRPTGKCICVIYLLQVSSEHKFIPKIQLKVINAKETRLICGGAPLCSPERGAVAPP